MSKEKNKCCAETHNGSRDIMSRMINNYEQPICGVNAKYFEGGHWYCGRHAPSKIRDREEKSYRKWQEQVVKRKELKNKK